ncbi:hypothetical protein MBLNU459_g0656t1 [Dothideomycetes sp. NU459]
MGWSEQYPTSRPPNSSVQDQPTTSKAEEQENHDLVLGALHSGCDQCYATGSICTWHGADEAARWEEVKRIDYETAAHANHSVWQRRPVAPSVSVLSCTDEGLALGSGSATHRPQAVEQDGETAAETFELDHYTVEKDRQDSGQAPDDFIAISGNMTLLKRPRQDRYILKDIPENIFANFNDTIRPRLPESPNIRLPFDHIPEKSIFVYRYLTDDFYSLVKKKINIHDKRKILKAALRALSEMHAKDIVHLDVKPDNILVDCGHMSRGIPIESVQISDVENAAYLPKGRCIKGMLPGNESWRSPEGHFRGELNKPSDMFSFGTMCIYAILGRVIFGIDDDFKKHEMQGALPHLIHLQRQICYFGDTDGVYGLLKHIDDDEISTQVLQMLWEGRDQEDFEYLPFSEWPEVQDVGVSFMDIIRDMMSLDPAKRITAAEALEYPWFADV